MEFFHIVTLYSEKCFDGVVAQLTSVLITQPGKELHGAGMEPQEAEWPGRASVGLTEPKDICPCSQETS